MRTTRSPGPPPATVVELTYDEVVQALCFHIRAQSHVNIDFGGLFDLHVDEANKTMTLVHTP